MAVTPPVQKTPQQLRQDILAALGVQNGAPGFGFDADFDRQVTDVYGNQAKGLSNIDLALQRAMTDFGTQEQRMGQNREQAFGGLAGQMAENGMSFSGNNIEAQTKLGDQYQQSLNDLIQARTRTSEDVDRSRNDIADQVRQALEELKTSYTVNAQGGIQERALRDAATASAQTAANPATPLSPAALPTAASLGITNPEEQIIGGLNLNGQQVFASNLGGIFNPTGGAYFGSYLDDSVPGMAAARNDPNRRFTGFNSTPNGGYQLVSGGGEKYDFNPDYKPQPQKTINDSGFSQQIANPGAMAGLAPPGINQAPIPREGATEGLVEPGYTPKKPIIRPVAETTDQSIQEKVRGALLKAQRGLSG